MGLGKTLQTIAHVLLEKRAGRLDRPALIVTLTSLVGNWQRELARFAPDADASLSLHGPERTARFAELADARRRDHDLSARRARPRRARASAAAPARSSTRRRRSRTTTRRRAEAVRALDARHRLCLSGTPIENHLGELWSLFDFLNPGLLGDARRVPPQFRAADRGAAATSAGSTALRERVRPYILRRTKDAVAHELPPKTELVRAGRADRRAARALREHPRRGARRRAPAHQAARPRAARRSRSSTRCSKLRQVCCDPRLVRVEAARGVAGSAKLDVLLELVDDAARRRPPHPGVLAVRAHARR